MRRKTQRILGVVILVLTLLISLAIPAFAGDSTEVLDSSTLENVAMWNNLSNDVVVENGKLIFPNNSTQYTRFISTGIAKTNTGLGRVASISCAMKFTQLPENEKFALVFGLSDIESGMGESGNVEIVFFNDNGIKAEILAYEEAGTPTVLNEAKTVGASLDKTFKLNAEISEKGILTVKANGKTIYSGSIPVTGEGRVGFVQTKDCGAEVSDVLVHLAAYDRPENTDISENFDNGTMNTAVLSSRVICIFDPNIVNHSASIEEYNGNNVYMLENCGGFYLGTVHSYSNFELSFDIPYFKASSMVDEEGKLTHVATGNFVISFGAPVTDTDKFGYVDAAGAVVFDGNLVYSYFDRETSGTHSYWKDDTPFSVKVTAVDKHITVYMKRMNAADYETVLEFDQTDMQSGKVHFWVPTWANMAIDNFVVKNLDRDPNLVEVEYKDGTFVWEDYEYEPFERVYKEPTAAPVAKTDTNAYWYLMIPAVAAICGVALLIVGSKKGKREVRTNEK